LKATSDYNYYVVHVVKPTYKYIVYYTPLSVSSTSSSYC
jgi:hypothetical protein